MFEVLTASAKGVPLDRHWPARLASGAAHAAFVLGAVAASRQPASVSGPAVRDTAIVLPSDPVPRRPSPPSLPGPPTAPLVPIPGPLRLAEPVAPGAELPPMPSVPWAPGPVTEWVAAEPRPGVGEPQTAPVWSRYTDEPPALLGHPPLRYPELLRQAGVEGEVLVEAVLDTLGRVEAGSATVVRSAHPLFDGEALAVVAGSRYRPGRAGHRPVRVRILVPVAFALKR